MGSFIGFGVETVRVGVWVGEETKVRVRVRITIHKFGAWAKKLRLSFGHGQVEEWRNTKSLAVIVTL